MQRPWNIIDTPVYSLLTYNENGTINMNICTYVTPISMQPKMYTIGVYINTKTLQNLQRGSKAILQLLSIQNLPLVRLLGKQSGNKINKQASLVKKNALINWEGNMVLKNASAYLKVELLQNNLTGDHWSYLYQVSQYKSFAEEVLMLSHLKQHKIISI